MLRIKLLWKYTQETHTIKWENNKNNNYKQLNEWRWRRNNGKRYKIKLLKERETILNKQSYDETFGRIKYRIKFTGRATLQREQTVHSRGSKRKTMIIIYMYMRDVICSLCTWFVINKQYFGCKMCARVMNICAYACTKATHSTFTFLENFERSSCCCCCHHHHHHWLSLYCLCWWLIPWTICNDD